MSSHETPELGSWAGRLTESSDGEAEIAAGDTSGVSAEERAVRIDVDPTVRAELTTTDRLDVLDHEISALVGATRLLADALDVLAKALQTAPAEEPGEARQRIAYAGREVRELLLSARTQD